VCGEIQVLGIDGAMLDVWQPALDTLLPVTLAPGVIGGVVEQIHVPLGPTR